MTEDRPQFPPPPESGAPVGGAPPVFVPVPDADPAALPATRLVAGDCGLICEIEGEREDIERLKVMGLCLGRRLHVIKTGDPMIVSVMGTRIGLARELAAHVTVRADVGHFCTEDRPRQ